MAQHAWRMAHQRNRLVGGDERFDQRNRVDVFGQVPQRAVAARIKDGVEIGLVDAVQAHRCGQLRGRGGVKLEAARQVGLERWLIAFRVQWRLATGRRGQRDGDAGILERVIRRSQFFQPETGFAAGVAEGVMRRQDHQYFFHVVCPVIL